MPALSRRLRLSPPSRCKSKQVRGLTDLVEAAAMAAVESADVVKSGGSRVGELLSPTTRRFSSYAARILRRVCLEERYLARAAISPKVISFKISSSSNETIASRGCQQFSSVEIAG